MTQGIEKEYEVQRPIVVDLDAGLKAVFMK